MERKNIILFGYGELGKKWLSRLGKKKVLCFTGSYVDKCKNVEINGIPVVHLEELKKYKNELIIFLSLAEKHHVDAKNLLKKYGYDSWIDINPYDRTILRCEKNVYFDFNCIFQGNNYLGSNVILNSVEMKYSSYIGSDSELRNTIIGKYSALGPRCKLIIGQHPTSKFVSIHPAFYSISNVTSNIFYTEEKFFNEFRYTEKGYSLEIGNDVWIGANVCLMEGITIGDGAIIAAGSVVVKDVPAYTIVGGVPASKIRMRFDEMEIEYLNQLKWWDRDEVWIKEHASYFKDISLLMKYCSVVK